MEKHIIRLELSPSGIEKAIREIKRYQSVELPLKLQVFTNMLAERGVAIARAEILDVDAIFSGELFASMKTEEKKVSKTLCVYTIQADSTHAAWVEFGTGIVGSNSPYQYPLPKGVHWKYISGKQLKKNIKKGIFGWFYPAPDGDGFYFTDGMESRPFMFHTAIRLKKQIDDVAREVFR